MQETRRYILEILKEQGACTIDEIVAALSVKMNRQITTVTVRHHLERLRQEHLVKPPQVKRRNSPGRPQHTYALTQQAIEAFPSNYAGFAEHLLEQVKAHLPPREVNVILDEMAVNMAKQAGVSVDDPLELRVQQTVEHMNDQGYQASWQAVDKGYLIVTTNCPYERIAEHHAEVCQFDLHLMTSLLGTVPRFMGTLREGDPACRYLVPYVAEERAKSVGQSH